MTAFISVGFQNFETYLETFAESLKKLCQSSLGRIDKKLLSHLYGFRCGGGGCLGEFVKIGNLAMKIFFQIMLNKLLKICKNDNLLI